MASDFRTMLADAESAGRCGCADSVLAIAVLDAMSTSTPTPQTLLVDLAMEALEILDPETRAASAGAARDPWSYDRPRVSVLDDADYVPPALLEAVRVLLRDEYGLARLMPAVDVLRTPAPEHPPGVVHPLTDCETCLERADAVYRGSVESDPQSGPADQDHRGVR